MLLIRVVLARRTVPDSLVYRVAVRLPHSVRQFVQVLLEQGVRIQTQASALNRRSTIDVLQAAHLCFYLVLDPARLSRHTSSVHTLVHHDRADGALKRLRICNSHGLLVKWHVLQHLALNEREHVAGWLRRHNA